MIKSMMFDLPSFELSQIVGDDAGHHRQVFRSPYDVPETMKASYDPDQHLFQLDFNYPSIEPSTKTVEVQPDLQITFGKHSGNIYNIIAQVNSPEDVPQLSGKVEKSLHKLQGQMPASIENFYVVTQVVNDKSDEFFPMALGV